MQSNQQQQQQRIVTMYSVRPAPAPTFNNAVHGGQSGSAEVINPSFVPVDHYRHGPSMGIGATLIVVGIVYVALAIGAMFLVSATGSQLASQGIGCGIMCLIAGSFGIEAGQSKTVGKVVTFLVLSVLTSIYAFCQAIFGVWILILTVNGKSHETDKTGGADIGIESALMITGFVAGIASIWGSSLGCRTACCCACCVGYRRNNSYSTQYEILTEDDAYNANTQQQQQQQQQYRNPSMDRQLAYPAPANMFQQQTSQQAYITASHSAADVPMINVK